MRLCLDALDAWAETAGDYFIPNGYNGYLIYRPSSRSSHDAGPRPRGWARLTPPLRMSDAVECDIQAAHFYRRKRVWASWVLHDTLFALPRAEFLTGDRSSVSPKPGKWGAAEDSGPGDAAGTGMMPSAGQPRPEGGQRDRRVKCAADVLACAWRKRCSRASNWVLQLESSGDIVSYWQADSRERPSCWHLKQPVACRDSGQHCRETAHRTADIQHLQRDSPARYGAQGPDIPCSSSASNPQLSQAAISSVSRVPQTPFACIASSHPSPLALSFDESLLLDARITRLYPLSFVQLLPDCYTLITPYPRPPVRVLSLSVVSLLYCLLLLQRQPLFWLDSARHGLIGFGFFVLLPFFHSHSSSHSSLCLTYPASSLCARLPTLFLTADQTPASKSSTFRTFLPSASFQFLNFSGHDRIGDTAFLRRCHSVTSSATSTHPANYSVSRDILHRALTTGLQAPLVLLAWSLQLFRHSALLLRLSPAGTLSTWRLRRPRIPHYDTDISTVHPTSYLSRRTNWSRQSRWR